MVGPLTLKQFGYILGAGGFSFLIWTFIPIKLVAILLIVPVAGLFLALAFIKINNRTFGEILESAFAYYTGAKIYTWKQPTATTTTNEEEHVEKVIADATKEVIISKANKDRIHDLALGLDVLDRTIEEEERK